MAMAWRGHEPGRGRRESNGLIFTRMSYLIGLVSGRYRLRVILAVSGWQYLADCPAPNVVISR